MSRRLLLLPALAATLLVVPSALAHPLRMSDEARLVPYALPGGLPGQGATFQAQHEGPDGHIAPVSQGVEFVGKAEVTNPAGAGNTGRVADVSAYGDHAFLTAFREPTCEQAGAHVIDISDPEAPFEVTSAFMETTPHNYAGEGSQTLRMTNQHFDGVLFIHQNETCPNAPAPTAARTRGGINIWDVTDATEPELLVKHAGDYTNPSGGMDAQANSTHSAFAWTNEFDNRTYAVLVDNEELTDVDILDITNPRDPVLVNDTLDLDALFGVGQDTPRNLTSVFSHDMIVKKVGRRYVMSMSYWDGGYVLLDVTDPRPGQVSLVAESDYAPLDEERLARGQETEPEGNGHQSELSPSNRFLVATDEDFNPYRVIAEITSGPFAGTEYTAISGSDTPPVDADTSISGTPTYVGEACGPLPAVEGGVALVERGTCTFQQKIDMVDAAGYDAGIVFNNVRADCQAFVLMLAAGDIPFVFVNRLTGLQLLQVPGATAANACTTATPASPSPASTTIEAIFDGWGYIRLFGTDIPRNGGSGSISQIDTFALPESQDEAFATGFGDLSVHEVALDPNHQVAYVSYYALGFRILKYGHRGLQQVGAFIDEGGNNFWGVEIHEVDGRELVLASDRDFGLYIFGRHGGN